MGVVVLLEVAAIGVQCAARGCLQRVVRQDLLERADCGLQLSGTVVATGETFVPLLGLACAGVGSPTVHRLDASRQPGAVELRIPLVSQAIAAVESELRTRATTDPDRCCGYFPALADDREIISDLPACQAFAEHLPNIWHGGHRYEFNFLRLSLVQQSADASYHLASDAATALTGDVTTINRRQIRRLLLNLSARSDRSLHYLNLDPGSLELAVDGSYVRVADPEAVREHGLIATIPRRRGSTVHGLIFASNLVLHSGVDDEHGHFIAAYGIEIDASESAALGANVSNAMRTRSRSSH